MFHSESTPTVTASVFTGNRAGRGGGMYSTASSNVVGGSLFGGNYADEGAGIYVSNSSNPTIKHCTFTGNTAAVGGGGIYSDQGSTSTVTNSIIRGNTAPLQPDILENTGLTIVSYSCIMGPVAQPGDGIIYDADPMFVRIPNDGGDGWGDDPDTPDADEGANDDYGDLRLRSASPCIDTGDPGFVPGPGETDLDGHLRMLCGRVDMGAYESGIGDHDCSRSVQLDDFAVWRMCMFGPYPGFYPAGCEVFDFDLDDDVDLTDIAGFQNVFGGP
jgi:predicted outer membrane repeat protein